jgi:hypothetical protein
MGNKEQAKSYSTYLAKERYGGLFKTEIHSNKIKEIHVHVYKTSSNPDPDCISLADYMSDRQRFINKALGGVYIFLNHVYVKDSKSSRVRFKDCYDILYSI